MLRRCSDAVLLEPGERFVRQVWRCRIEFQQVLGRNPSLSSCRLDRCGEACCIVGRDGESAVHEELGSSVEVRLVRIEQVHSEFTRGPSRAVPGHPVDRHQWRRHVELHHDKRPFLARHSTTPCPGVATSARFVPSRVLIEGNTRSARSSTEPLNLRHLEAVHRQMAGGRLR